MRVEGNLGSGNCRCKGPEMGGNWEGNWNIVSERKWWQGSWEVGWGHVQTRCCWLW